MYRERTTTTITNSDATFESDNEQQQKRQQPEARKLADIKVKGTKSNGLKVLFSGPSTGKSTTTTEAITTKPGGTGSKIAFKRKATDSGQEHAEEHEQAVPKTRVPKAGLRLRTGKASFLLKQPESLYQK